MANIIVIALICVAVLFAVKRVKKKGACECSSKSEGCCCCHKDVEADHKH